MEWYHVLMLSLLFTIAGHTVDEDDDFCRLAYHVLGAGASTIALIMLIVSFCK